MDNKNNLPEFTLEDIMAEFGSEQPEAQDSPEPSRDQLPAEPAQQPEEEAPESTDAEDAEAPEQSGEAEVPEEADEPEQSEEAEAAEDADESEAEPDEAVTDDTVRLDDLSQIPAPKWLDPEMAEPVEEDDRATRVIPSPEEQEALLQQRQEPEKGAEEAPETFRMHTENIPTPQPIQFRSRLSELKRKLVAGPEKRYYDLAEMGLGRVHIAIFLNLLIVALCAGGTGLYAAGMVMANRLRLMVFSQILAMMLSALLGCYVLMDGIFDLFTGKFSLNSMLFLTLAACAADAVFCLQELRVPCCAAFSLEMTFALWNRSLSRSTEMGQMDTLRKANRLDGIVKVPEYFGSRDGILRTEGRVEDFMENYAKRTGPERTLNIYALVSFLLCIGVAVLAGVRHNMSLAVQVFSTSMLVAVPASAFVSQSRPAAILERRLHMVGTVICGWQGVKKLCGKASFPLADRDLFPLGAIKLNGVKFFDEAEPEQVIAAAASLMAVNGGSLEPVLTQLRKSRNGPEYAVEDFQAHTEGIRGLVNGREMFLGSVRFLQDQGIAVAEDARIGQAIYCAMDGRFTAVFAINYSRTKASAAGLVTLNSYRKIRSLVLSRNFMIDSQLIREKFGLKTKRYDFPDRDIREGLEAFEPDPEIVAGALSTQLNLSSSAYAVTGSRALRTSCRVGAGIHLFAGILGLLIMAALAYLGDLQLLSPINVLLYQAVWMIPGLLITEWTRTV